MKKAEFNLLEERVRQEMKDLESVKFDSVVMYFEPLSDAPFEAKGVYRICGLLNAKNSFGGYVGYRRFIAELVEVGKTTDSGEPVAVEDAVDRRTGLFDKFWKMSCKGKITTPSEDDKDRQDGERH